MDNLPARIHVKVPASLSERVALIFTAPYTSDANPIENCFRYKKRIKKYRMEKLRGLET